MDKRKLIRNNKRQPTFTMDTLRRGLKYLESWTPDTLEDPLLLDDAIRQLHAELKIKPWPVTHQQILEDIKRIKQEIIKPIDKIINTNKLNEEKQKCNTIREPRKK